MLTEPTIEYRSEQPYASIRKRVAMQDIPKELPALIPEILQWVEKKHLKQEGPVFFRYLSMEKGNMMETEVGVPLSEFPQGDERVKAGSFPSGKYLTARHTGPYHELPKSHMAMDSYAKQHDLKEGRVTGEKGQVWGTRAELYITDPDEVKDSSKWETELLLLLED